jgi:hypothetical protein
MICSSLNRFRFMSVLLERAQPYNERVSGEHVTSAHLTGRCKEAVSWAQAKGGLVSTTSCSNGCRGCCNARRS